MMFRLFHIALLGAVIVLGGIGVSRLSFNVEISSAAARHGGWKARSGFKKAYDRPDQLIITLQAGSDIEADEAVLA